MENETAKIKVTEVAETLDVLQEENEEPQLKREWVITAPARRVLQSISAQKDQTGILEEPSLPISFPDQREAKIVVYGKTGVGKTSVICNLCGLDIPGSHIETTGIQVYGTYWPVQLKDGRNILFKYKFWDTGATGIKKYTYLAQACNVDPKVVIFVFSVTDRDSFEDLRKQLQMKSGTKDYQKVIKIAIATKTDHFLQSNVSRSELSAISKEHQIPIYFLRNLSSPSSQDVAQNEKDLTKIKNDLAEFLLAKSDYRKFVKPFKESRFKITKKVNSPMRANTPRSTRGSLHSEDGTPSLSRRESMDDPLVEIGSPTEEKERREAMKKGPTKVECNHQNFEIVYDMLVGIKNAVVESYAKRASRNEELELNYNLDQIALLPRDFKEAHSWVYSTEGVKEEDLDTMNTEQCYKYNFKFRDHAPFVFSNIRSYFGFDDADYLNELTNHMALYELISPGKSGSFFYFSLNYKFIIKTITEAEAEYFMQILQNYYQYMLQNPNSLLCKFYGLYMVQPRAQGKEMFFVVMENAFPHGIQIDERYDLKGSTVGRAASVQEKESENVILKDLDITRVLAIGPELKKKLTDQLEKDTKLLADNNIMDYSFLVGVHKNYSTRLKQRQEQQQPSDDSSRDKPPVPRRKVAVSIFKQWDGGLLSQENDEVYYLLIIDIFQTWNTRKKLENSVKSLLYESTGLSAVQPSVYRDRFVSFMGKLIT